MLSTRKPGWLALSVVVGTAAVTMTGAVMVGVSSAATQAAAGQIVCPDVKSQLPAAIPATAQAEVTQNLTLLQTQITEANTRLASTVGQGGANFVQNAILGPLADKRTATINRIATAIGRTAAKPALDTAALSTCVVQGGAAAAATTAAAAAATTAAAAAATTAAAAAAAGQIVCPDVKSQLPAVIPASAQAEVTQNLTLLQTQITEANARLASTVGQGGANFVQNAILGPLASKRTATINRIATAIGRTAAKPNLNTAALSTCTVSAAAAGAAATTAAAAAGAATTAAAAAAPAVAATGPVAADFIDINKVPPTNTAVKAGANGSTGTLNETCTLSGHQNSDNVIAAPGVTNGAHHLHDYVGNKDTSGASTNTSLAAAGTTCTNGDQSTFFWTVVRDLTKGTNPQKRVAGELAADLNVGLALTPKSFTLQFQGNPNSKVTAQPQFLRILQGDAKAPVNGGANQHAQFTCQGFTNRISTTKYTLCPGGRGFTRVHEFPSCWDGKNTDSANHRTHVVFPDPKTQVCPAANPVVIPKLVTTLVYDVPAGTNFAIDSFPESLHSPISDHDDFINVASAAIEGQIVSCINTGKSC